ncbi:Ribosome bioproteinsis protein brx1 [Puccinia graminis f. sp. tritici]|uniref:Ribosome bioproteinsis protein brx1 n=1 Tax=Puccinia graminis f. sp. tritici TaxID=56615 RepID=A0A5B0QNV8_PUCGR|nr:Ribosome bioproteinsis protein brx1 [Puccinia graminis f. sp. tritici]
MASRSAQATATSKKRKNVDREEAEQDVPGGAGALTTSSSSTKPYKSKVLILCSRGITYRMRHLMNDLANLITHGKKDAKLDSKHALPSINELADLNSCNHALYFESRRHSDLYLWASRCPNGPSIRFHVVNVHTMDEMKMTGNCLKGSRPIVTFGKEFEDEAHWKVCKEVLTNVFAVPKTARKAKPFVDHIISFSIVDGKIWFRNYQILQKSTIDPAATHKKNTSEADDLSLTEIGPRFVLTPIKLFEGSFSGPCLWENKDFVPPVQALKEHKTEAALKYVGRKEQESSRESRKEIINMMRPDDELEKRKVFA